MKHRITRLSDFLVPTFLFSTLLLAGDLVAQQAEQGNNRSIDSNNARVVEYWTSDRRAAAVPRDLRIDSRGLGYMRLPNGTLQPYGHQISAIAPNSPTPMKGRPPANDDTTPPNITLLSPNDDTTIGAVQTFSAQVTDDSGVRSVTFNLTETTIDSPTQSFAGSSSGGDIWSVDLQGFRNGEMWEWTVTATDTVRRGGNTTTSSPPHTLTVAIDPGNGGGGTVTNGIWTTPGPVKDATGRIFFEMPRRSNRKGPWNAFVCSGAVATDDTGSRSVIITAAHCVYDDVHKAFARNILFIPNGTDSNCSNDPVGCWTPTFGAVDADWTTRTFPDNVDWDYAYYVVPDTGAHEPPSEGSPSEALDAEAGSLVVSFGNPNLDFTHALGYSLSEDPNFMYCAEEMTTQGTVNWWLQSCGLSGGASGGPWVQPMDIVIGSGPVISINSWGFTGSPGMAGPILNGTSAECVFIAAKGTAFATVASTDGDAGVVWGGGVNCP